MPISMDATRHDKKNHYLPQVSNYKQSMPYLIFRHPGLFVAFGHLFAPLWFSSAGYLGTKRTKPTFVLLT
jgi:hypothetical protein